MSRVSEIIQDESSIPERGARGWAVKLDGVVSIRTAGTRPEGAKINGLCLFFGVDPHTTGRWNDAVINDQWAKAVARVYGKHAVEVVRVELIEREF